MDDRYGFVRQLDALLDGVRRRQERLLDHRREPSLRVLIMGGPLDGQHRTIPDGQMSYVIVHPTMMVDFKAPLSEFGEPFDLERRWAEYSIVWDEVEEEWLAVHPSLSEVDSFPGAEDWIPPCG